MNDLKQSLEKLLTKSVAMITSGLMGISSQIKNAGYSPEISNQIDSFFQSWMKSNRELTEKLKQLIDANTKLEKSYKKLDEEKQRLESLYTAGIALYSEIDMQSLLSKAIDTVIKELKADAGFIVLVDQNLEIDSVFARNMDYDENIKAKNMSESIVKKAVSQGKPVQINDAEEYLARSRHSSILDLGIQSALCVPLLAKSSVLGVVYLDRRDKKNSFNETDLVFLLSFARQIVQGLEISREFTELEKKIASEPAQTIDEFRQMYDCSEIIGSSNNLFDVLKTAAKVSPTNASVILLGENGTGKELLARFIHTNSKRKEGPLVAINCSAIPQDLLESELFGYEAGAFTGATKTKKGKIELADGGTLFLDEIGELNINLQAKLLRVLQNHEVERLGGLQNNKVDIRIISATNKNILAMVKEKKIREDLYYRLKVISLKIPPLRERQDDIEELSNYFLRKDDKENRNMKISDEALEILEGYAWPGNVRELENVIIRGIVLAKSSIIEATDLPLEILESELTVPRIQAGQTLSQAETEFRKRYVLRTLKQTSSKSEAAKLLGINRTHFHRILSQLGLDKK